MSERIMTLFGEEIVPEQQKAATKSRAKKKPGDDAEQTETAGAEEMNRALSLPLMPELINEAQPVVEEPAVQVPKAILPEVEQTTAQEIVPDVAAGEPSNTAEPVALTPAIIIPDMVEPEAEEIATDTAADEPGAALAVADEQEPVPVRKRAKAKVDEENIILPEDWQGDKKYYSIGEVAELFKVKTSHIRFWTNEFKIKVRTTRKGDRLFTPEQIRELRTIHHLVKERGFTLTGAKARLKEQKSIDVETVDLKQSLTQLRNKLVIIKNQLV